MRKFAAGLGVLLSSFAASGKCVSYPDLLVKFEVRYCQEVTIRASRSKWKLEGVAGSESFDFQKPGETFTTLVISGEVTEASYVSTRQGRNMPFEAEPFISLGRTHLELVGGPEPSCPTHVPIDIYVVAEPRCCDVVPTQGECISPFTRVREERDPQRWFKLGPYVEPPPERKSWWRSLW